MRFCDKIVHVWGLGYHQDHPTWKYTDKYDILWSICQCASECDIRENFASNEYTNIFESRKLNEQMSEYIRIKNLTRMNARISIRLENCTNI